MPQTSLAYALSVDSNKRFGSFGNGGAVGKVARSKGIGNGTVVLYTYRVIEALIGLSKRFVSWPSPDQRNIISRRIQETYGIPDCVGFVDGTHVQLNVRPAIDGEVYFNRKHRYSFNVQLICDDQRRILWYQLGWPGSVHDSTVLSHSQLFKNPRRYFTNDEYLIGDTGYALSPWMIVGYKGDNASIPENAAFNERLSSMRVVIEHTNGILKSRFCSLKGIRTQLKSKQEIGKVNDHILACIVLYNIMNVMNDEWSEEDMETDVQNINDYSMDSTDGSRKRELLKRMLINFHK